MTRTRERARPKRLNARDTIFVDEYCIDLDAKRAAIEAGYSESVAAKKAYSWVGQGGSKPHVYAAIQDRMRKTCDRLQLTAERIEDELMKIAFGSMRNFIRIDDEGQPQIDLTRTDDRNLDALAEVSTEIVLEGKGEEKQRVRKTRIKLHSKLDALEKLAQRVRFYKDAESDKSDFLVQTFAEIWARGSKAPIRRDINAELDS